MEQFFEGSVTVDRHLYLVKEDGSLYNHLQLDMYAPLIDCIHEDDIKHLDDLIEEINDSGKTASVAIRMKCQDETYHWFLVQGEKESFAVKGQAVYTLKLTDWLLQLRYLNNIREKSAVNDAYLNMLDGMLLMYDRNKDYLEVFEYEDHKKVTLFRGSAFGWYDSKKVTVADPDQEAFHDFCEDMEAGRQGRYEILTNMFSDNEKSILYSFKCCKASNKTQTVLGCIVPMANTVSKVYNSENEKDVGIDALNKRAITEYAKRAIHSASASGKKIYIGIIDLDDFKLINDTFGHLFGDEVLQVCGDIIKEALGRSGVLGRIGGDELMIVVDGITDYTELRNLLRTIRTNIEWAYKGKKEDVITSCSIGIAAFPDQGKDYDEVFAKADKMLYLAKAKGKNRYIIYTPELHDKLMDNGLDKKEVPVLETKDVSWYQRRKATVMKKLVNEYLTLKTVSTETIITEIAYANDLQDVLYFNSEKKEIIKWTPEGFKYNVDDPLIKLVDDKFYSAFDHDEMFVMGNYAQLAGICSGLVEELKNRGVLNAIFYKMPDSKGFMMFARNTSRHLWSDGEVVSFAVVGKCLEIGINNR